MSSLNKNFTNTTPTTSSSEEHTAALIKSADNSRAIRLRGQSAYRYLKEKAIPSYVNSPRRPSILKRRFSDPVVDVELPDLLAYKRTKLGDHSVHPTHCGETAILSCTDVLSWRVGQDFLGHYVGSFFSMPQGFRWDNMLHHHIIESPIRMAQTINRAQVSIMANMPVGVERPPHRPVQYTRILWDSALIQGLVDISSISSSIGSSGVPDPKIISSMVTARFPWNARLVEACASTVGTGLTIYNNSSLYMKGLTTGMLVRRLVLSGIPVPEVDLHQAPVQFLYMEDAQHYQAIFQIIREYSERGDFILVEGVDWVRTDVVPLMYLSLGGAPFPVGNLDRGYPTQALRWPRIRFLVLCSHPPPPVPQQEVLNGNQMLGFLRNMAISRSEQQDYAQGWYDASYLMGTEWIKQYGPANDDPRFDDRDAPPPFPVRPVDPGEHAPHWLDQPEHHLFDGPNGAGGLAEPYEFPPLHYPDPYAAAQAAFDTALLRWQNGYQRWALDRQRRNEHLERQGQRQPAGGRGRGGVRQRGRHNRGGQAGGVVAIAQGPQPFDEATYELEVQPRPIFVPPPPGFFRGDQLDYEEPDEVPGNPPREHPPALRYGWNDRNWQNEARHYARWRLSTPLWESAKILKYSRPNDTNLLLRMAGLVDKRGVKHNVFPILTTKAFTTANNIAQLTDLAIFMGAHIRTGATTTLFNLNLTGGDLQIFLAHQNRNSYFSFNLQEQGILCRNPAVTNTPNNCPTYACAVGMFIKTYTGLIISPWLLSQRDWCGRNDCGAQPANQWLAQAFPTHTPRQGSLYSMLRWLSLYPPEWGITAGSPIVNLTGEWLIWDTPAGQQGWYIERGDMTYLNAAHEGGPFNIITYGQQALNMVFQLQPLPNPLNMFQQRPVPCQVTGKWTPIAGVPMPYPQGRGAPIFNEQLRQIEPCSLLTYDWVTNVIMIPWIPIDYFPNGVSYWLSTLDTMVTEIGITCGGNVTTPLPAIRVAGLPAFSAAMRQLQIGADNPGNPPAAPAGAPQANDNVADYQIDPNLAARQPPPADPVPGAGGPAIVPNVGGAHDQGNVI